MIIRNRMPPWHENFKLINGHVLLLRPIRSEDIAPLEGAIALMEPQVLRERFTTAHLHGDQPDKLKLTHPNPKSEIVLVAAESLPPGEALIAAIAYANITPETRNGEFIILVSQFVHEQGLEHQLLRKLVKWSRGKHLEHLSGELRADHKPLLDLAQSLGFTTQQGSTDALVRVQLVLQPSSVPPTASEDQPL